ncbi:MULTISPECIES: hypothetical protein [unclassified Shinella]|uniref:hypothetical protein n=1 Tax=unclassified Shinella TaxID=2643062 RepID=UPI00234F94EF|nr:MULTISPECIES: hypothetical protein [unclassified Shinella]MCO5153352.1 hypothetical protein [Shinella sp.]MDC7260531.1 hypothetical protein [Shinella sp. HY16]MDC7267426.1 hypothetical protein [Shinella sp. YZ44]
MRKVTVFTPFKIDLKDFSNPDLDWLCGEVPSLRDRLPVIEDQGEVEVPLALVDDDELLAELADRGLNRGEWLERTYRYLAEGDVAAAMDELHREFQLAPPSHECRIADLLAGLSNEARVNG